MTGHFFFSDDDSGRALAKSLDEFAPSEALDGKLERAMRPLRQWAQRFVVELLEDLFRDDCHHVSLPASWWPTNGYAYPEPSEGRARSEFPKATNPLDIDIQFLDGGYGESVALFRFNLADVLEFEFPDQEDPDEGITFVRDALAAQVARLDRLIARSKEEAS